MEIEICPLQGGKIRVCPFIEDEIKKEKWIQRKNFKIEDEKRKTKMKNEE